MGISQVNKFFLICLADTYNNFIFLLTPLINIYSLTQTQGNMVILYASSSEREINSKYFIVVPVFDKMHQYNFNSEF